ncbi:MAG TPA: hypothetical protein VE170_17330 [Candidatus Limnocylindria bacterium]|nr:hypothetical protein [Candidatus Limnocylindria bacterium]
MTIDLTKAAAYSEKTPYDVWQDQDGIPICHGLGIDELKTLELVRGSARPKPARCGETGQGQTLHARL